MRTISGYCLLVILLCALAQAQPVISPGSTVNAADYSRNIAPGSFVTIFGQDLAPGFFRAESIPLPTALGGTSVEVVSNGATTLLPLLYVTPTQVAGQLSFDLGPNAQLRVVTAEGNSAFDAFTVMPNAPAFYSVSQQGDGRALAIHLNGDLVSRQRPLKPGQWASVYANSIGAVDPLVPAGFGAGDGAPGNPLNRVVAPVSVTIDGLNTEVGYAGLAPYLAGVYQLNIFTPYYNVIGDLVIRLRAGGVETNVPISVPAMPNGFYFVLTGGKFPNGQTRNAIPGPGTSIVFRHEAPDVWNDPGTGQWTVDNGLDATHVATSGLALTLKNNGAIVYDNNGIETETTAGYYDNGNGAVIDGDKPGLFTAYSMSNDLKGMFAGHFALNQSTTFDQIIGYFDGNGQGALPFDPDNVYNTYRMHIFSEGAGSLPGVNGFNGDVFSSATTPGTFEWSPTTASRVFSDGFTDPIYRMVYTLNAPVTLPAGSYWFSHECLVPDAPGGQAISESKVRATKGAQRPLPPGKVYAGR